MRSPPTVGKCDRGHGFMGWKTIRRLSEEEAWYVVLTSCPDAQIAGVPGVTAKQASKEEVYDWCSGLGAVVHSDGVLGIARAVFRKGGEFILLERNYRT